MRTALALLVIALLGAFVALRFEVTTDIGDFMPTGHDRELARIAQAVAKGPISRSIVITIEADDAEAAVEASRIFDEEVRGDEALLEQLAYFEPGPPQDLDRALWELYHPRRLSFVARTRQEAEALVSDEGLAAAAGDVQRRLASPLSTLVTRAAPEDPFLAFPRLFERVQQGGAGGNVAVIDGRFVAGERWAVIFVGTEAPALDAEAQRGVIDGLRAAHERLGERMPVGVFESSGLAKFSIVAERTIKADIQRTTVLSVVGLVLLCLVVLRSARLALLASIPLGCAMLAATASSLLLYGRVHGLTLAFGGALFGVCIDYVVHLWVHQVQEPDAGGPWATLRRIRPALVLGSGTTMAGFAVIAASSFPGLREVAIFATVGVAAALGATMLLLPPLLPARPTRNAVRNRLSGLLVLAFEQLRRGRRWSLALLASALVVSAVGVATVGWDDDLGKMGHLDPELLAEDERVRARVAQLDQGRFVVAVGGDEEAALQVNDAVAEALDDAVAAGELGAQQGIGVLLPSAARQEAIADAIREAPDLERRFVRVFDGAGFNAELFAPFFEALRAEPPPPLQFDDLAASPAAPLVRSMRMPVEDDVAFLTLVRDVRDPEALARRVDAIDGATYVDQVQLMRTAVRDYRERTMLLLVVGLFAVAGVLAVRYRSARVVLAVMTPALLAAGVTIAVLSVARLSLDLVGLTAVLMVLSIGVDYGVFLAETDREHPEALHATLLGLVVCWATTVLGFGVLTLSDHPVMKTIGIVAAVGVSASLLLAPTALALLPRRRA